MTDRMVALIDYDDDLFDITPPVLAYMQDAIQAADGRLMVMNVPAGGDGRKLQSEWNTSANTGVSSSASRVRATTWDWPGMGRK